LYCIYRVDDEIRWGVVCGNERLKIAAQKTNSGCGHTQTPKLRWVAGDILQESGWLVSDPGDFLYNL
jgi:hypothetical protein